MGEVVVVAAITAKPGMRDQVEALARDTIIPATHGEPGCVTFALHRDTRNPDRVAFIERWESAEALGAHLQEPHLKQFQADVAALAAAPAEIYVLEPCGFGEGSKGTLGTA